MDGSMDAARPIGILAGGGALPLEIAHSIVARGGRVQIVSLAGETDRDFGMLPHVQVGWGEVGRLIATFKAAGVRDLVIIGAVTRPDLTKLRPDLGLIKRLPKILRILTGGGDDGVLRRVVGVLEEEGFRVRGPDHVAPELVCRAGLIAGPPPSIASRADGALGFEVVAALGPYDIGQAVVVAGGRVIAIEGAEGTDRLLRRLAHHPAAKGGVLVKRPKPSQDLRVDLPTIGPDTVTRAHEAGLAAIVVEADRVIRANRDELSTKARDLGLTVEAVVADAPGKVPAAVPRPSRRLEGRWPFHRAQRRLQLEADARRGAAVVAVLTGHRCGHAVVVSGRHVLAVAGDESIEEVLDRVGALRQWGDGRRRGVVVIRGDYLSDRGDSVIGAASAAGLAGLAVLTAGRPRVADLAARARAARLDLVDVTLADDDGTQGSDR